MTTPADLKASLDSRSTEDLLAIINARDEEQWRPEVFPLIESILRGRRVSIRKSTEPTEPVDPVLVSVSLFRHRSQAEEACAILEDEGIRTWISDESIVTEAGLEVGADLQVAEADVERASATLESFEAAEIVLPPADAPPCPECGALEATQDVEPIKEDVFDIKRSGRRWYFDCPACGHRWVDDGK